jgi:glycosyltransferase involved in cell wall biosynthesis
MRRFAAGGWDVLWVEGVAMRGVAGTGRTELRRVVAKLRASSGVRCVQERLYVLRPLPIPPAGRAGRALQLHVLERQVTQSVRRLGLGPPVVTWFSIPVAAPLRGRLGDTASVLYYQDRYDEFSHVDQAYLRSCLRSLAEECDVAIASADELAADLRSLGASPVVVSHGVEVDRFARAAPVPAQLDGFERPLIGCVGLVDDHLDMAAIRAVADAQRGTVVLVGSINTDVTSLQHPRIRFVERRPYAEMPAFMQAFDVCLVPFTRNRLTAAVNPIKLREYLAAGRPTVASALPEVEPYVDVVELVADGGDWAAAVARAVADDGESRRSERRRRVTGESWDVAFRRIEDLVMPLVEPGR